jgi:predicted RNA-binding protein YlxR (DUF448 family)
VTLDLSGRVAGRGAYLCADGSCWAAALKRRSIERALSVSLPAEVRERLASRDQSSIEGGISGT